MLNTVLSFFFATISLIALNQTDKFIEVSVSERVELKAQSAVIRITKNERNYGHDDYDEFYFDEFGYEEDEEYLYLLEESPKKVTKEMREAYEERQKQREIKEKEIEIAREEKKKVQEVALKTFCEKLSANNITYNLKIEQTRQNEFEYYNDDQDSDIEEVVYVTVNNENEYNKVMELSAGLSLNISNHEVKYEEIGSKRAMIIENLAQSAKSEAEMLAKSMGKKLGSVMNVSNLLPANSMAFSNMEQYYDFVGELNIYGGKSKLSPFSASRKTSLVYVYRFALLD